MGLGSIAAVSDAGPLIHLAEIGCLSVLAVFDRLHIPEAVCLEASKHKGKAFLKQILGLGNAERHSLPQSKVSRFIHENDLEKLDFGERECLYLCVKIGTPVLLTDDMAVREAAKVLHVTPVGSLGAVVRAYRMNQVSLPEAERYISDLHAISSLFVTRAIVDLALEQLHRYSDL
ncbi:MAG: hypothetical protein GY849_19130 [Deltaproteobacteria bacterium]|nr:hypothetical protein [Deltaproteobacteria bacterium]